MRVTIFGSILALALVLTGGDAIAYPQFQLAAGAERCQLCHLSPAGGGLLSDYGRSETGDTISGRGDGSLLHGAWTPPDWLALGGDARGVVLVKQLDGEAVDLLAFPMQLDLYARAVGGPVSLNVTVGLRGAARDRPAASAVTDWLASREHYLMYQRADDGPYLRAGRFFPVFGLRTQDHTAYPRRYLGQHTLEEPYAVGAGTTGTGWEAHTSAFVPNPVANTGAGPRATGATAYYERRLAADTRAIAAQAKVAVTGDDRRYTVGAVGKWWLEGPALMVLSELDAQVQTFAGDGAARLQLIGYLGVTRMMLPGWMIGGAVQRFAPDLMLRGSTRTAVELDLQAFPWAHVEVHLLMRAEATGGDTLTPNLLSLLQLHYFL